MYSVFMKRIAALSVLTIFSVSSAMAAWTGQRTIKALDSIGSDVKFVTLNGYVNSSCDENRILINVSDPEYRKQLLAMLLSAFHGGTLVNIEFTVNGNQCSGTRVILEK